MAWGRAFCGFSLVVFARAAENQPLDVVQSECGHSLLAQATLLSRRSAPYPQEYLLDVDYVDDANNELLAQDLPNKSFGGNRTNATAGNASNTSGNNTTEVVTIVTEPVVPTGDLLQQCVTRLPPVESVFYQTAPAGTLCMFGIDDRDEGAHCILDDMTKTGTLGWCWTADDKSEWGSCTESCPLFGQEAVLEQKVLQQQKEIDYWKELIVAMGNKTNFTANETNATNVTLNVSNFSKNISRRR
mmetsp:Transcript_52460/g.97115  ORF Transcript_52460/g.97115 Transcript_52460/m.97115 type:complete len:244 (-) Transcript_52460:72-803(-)